MVMHTRSMRHTRSGLVLPHDHDTSRLVSGIRTKRQSQMQMQTQSKKTALVTRTQELPQTPPQHQRRSKRKLETPTTTTTTSSPSTNRPSRPARPQLLTSQSLPTKLQSQTSVHTTRFLPESKVAHLKSWLEAQTSTEVLLDPTTPTRQPNLSQLLRNRRTTRMHELRVKGEWRRQIDDMSVAPVTSDRGVVRKLGAAFDSPEQQRQQPP